MAVEEPQLVTRSSGGHGHLTGQSGATQWRFCISSEQHTRTQIATETQPCHQHPTTATHNHFRTAKNSGTSCSVITALAATVFRYKLGPNSYKSRGRTVGVSIPKLALRQRFSSGLSGNIPFVCGAVCGSSPVTPQRPLAHRRLFAAVCACDRRRVLMTI